MLHQDVRYSFAARSPDEQLNTMHSLEDAGTAEFAFWAREGWHDEWVNLRG